MKNFGLMLLIFAFVLSSCGLAQNSDEENIDDLILEFEDMLLSTYETGEEDDAEKTEIMPFLWYREKSGTDSVTYDIQIDVVGDSALAEIRGVFPGILNLYYRNDSLDTVILEKEFIDTLVRFVTFTKDTLKECHGGWRVNLITGAEIFTENPAKMSIDSVKLFKEGVIDTLLTDIGAYFARNDLITLPSGELIDITIYSPDTTGFFFIHSFLRRSGFNYSNGIYIGTFKVPYVSGTYRVAFDGITEGTLLDTDTPYSTYAWIFPYKSE